MPRFRMKADIRFEAENINDAMLKVSKHLEAVSHIEDSQQDETGYLDFTGSIKAGKASEPEEYFET